MTEQPETLRLAKLLDGDESAHHEEAAAELRRLHEVNQQLLEALRNISLCSQNSMSSRTECGTIARAAIAKAEVKE